MNDIKINSEFLISLSNDGRLKDFAMFVYLKSKHPHYFNYSASSLSADVNVSRATIGGYIKRFIDYGWVRVCRGKGGKYKNLAFLNVGKVLKLKKSIKLKFKILGGWKKIYSSLNGLIVKFKIKQFKKIKELGQYQVRATKSSQVKTMERFKRKYNISEFPDQNAKFKISMNSIAKLLNVSRSTASRIIKSLKSSGELLVYQNRTSLGCFKNIRLAAAALNKFPNSYYTGTNVILVSCNEYDFI